MSGALARRLLRLAAIAIAVAAWLDPSSARTGRPRVAVIDLTAGGLGSRVRGELARSVALASGRDPSADAWVVVADDEEPEVPADVPVGVMLSLITVTPPARALVLEALDAPERVGPGARVRVSATFSGRGLTGATSTFGIRAGPLEIGRASHRWTGERERFVARFDLVLPHDGPNHLVVDTLDADTRSRRSRGDAVVVAEERRVSVLVFEGRPSWTTTFARRALEGDRRFEVRALSRVSRGIAVMAGGVRPKEAPTPSETTLTPRLLERARVAVVGAPEALGAGEVAALGEFVRRGGALVLAPDRRPDGPYPSLVSNPVFDEVLLEDPVDVAQTDAPELSWLASELAVPRVLPAGARVVGRAGSASGRPGVWSLPSGAGQILFVGGLDAWRFRGRPSSRFEAWWPRVVAWLASGADAASLSLDRSVAEPHDRVAIRLRSRAPAGAEVSVRAGLGPSGHRDGSPPAGLVRLWPTAEAGTVAGVLNAPATEGVYAVSGTFDPEAPRDRWLEQPLVVARGARRPRGDDDRWRAATSARSGTIATFDGVDRVARTIEAGGTRPRLPDRRFPMRSAWWLLPFAACLGGEWWLRRRAGLR